MLQTPFFLQGITHNRAGLNEDKLETIARVGTFCKHKYAVFYSKKQKFFHM